jgi:hypothetical protein
MRKTKVVPPNAFMDNRWQLPCANIATVLIPKNHGITAR